MTYLLLSDHSDHNTFNWSDFPNSKMEATEVPRQVESEDFSQIGQGLLRSLVLRTFRSVTGRSIFIC